MSTGRAQHNDVQQPTGVTTSDQPIRNRLHEGCLNGHCANWHRTLEVAVPPVHPEHV